MTDIDSILNRIRTGLAKHGRKTRISQETGIPVAVLSAVAKPTWNPNANRIRELDAAIRKVFPGEQPDPPQQPE